MSGVLRVVNRDRRRDPQRIRASSCCPLPVLQVMHLFEDDDTETLESGRTGANHVSQHLGGHDYHRRLPVDDVVAGEQVHVLLAIPSNEVSILLVRERLDRRRVADPFRGCESDRCGCFGDQGHPGVGWGGHDDEAPRSTAPMASPPPYRREPRSSRPSLTRPYERRAALPTP